MGLWPYGMTAEKKPGKRPNVRKEGIREVIVIFGSMLPDLMLRNKTLINRMTTGLGQRKFTWITLFTQG